MPKKAKHAFGALERIDESIQNGVIDAFDVLFVKDENGKPYVGWVDSNGEKVVVSNDAELEALESGLATKADASDVAQLEKEVDAKVDAETVQTMIKEYTSSVIEVVEF